ncbi:hypothetical protein TDMWS_05450 [Thermodesulfomicrobium sp. WS]|uniref:tetratricopeptide repeat protein n=1 Tax=Thermodesulfomicrobium sp. WS TaxID=3004129 RepID=UPI002490920A|nr:tetratricopeptide repeat protein [Thermodesulfomicrobium sp. WS]BDV00460.1 hypothetical protein TDMWS_05450 [Thermodesulfomicrobium sp. WS]
MNILSSLQFLRPGWRMAILAAVLFSVVLVSLTPPALAGFDEGLAAYDRGDYATALKEWRPLAEQGHAGAQNKLGVMYAKGQGVSKDDAEALKWFRKAAEQGYAAAQGALGFMYGDGRGVPQDYAEAVKWYRKAAEQGDTKAQNNLGAMYKNGRGVPQDYAEAVKWYRKAAEQGDTKAQNNLGAMYEDGQGVPEDKVLAYALYNLSAANDSSSENKARSNRDWLAHKLSREALLRGQELSRQLAQPGNFSKALDAYLADTARQGDNPPARNAQKPGKGRAGTP